MMLTEYERSQECLNMTWRFPCKLRLGVYYGMFSFLNVFMCIILIYILFPNLNG